MTRTRAFFAGLLAGLVAAIAMTAMMLLLARFAVATPLFIIGDRLSVFISPGPFLSLMGRIGGYNHLKQLGVGSTIAGQLLVGAIGGAIFGLVMRRDPTRGIALWTVPVFVVLPTVLFVISLWPVLGTSYRGFPIDVARIITLVGFGFCLLVFERATVLSFWFLTRAEATIPAKMEFSPVIGRRTFLLGTMGAVIAGGGAALAKKLWRIATFSYDGTQYKGRVVQAITPNDLFYCVTKYVVDPQVDVGLWHLEITGLVQHRATWRFQDLIALPAVEQETTLMCISNGLDAGLISNAKWKGLPLRDFLTAAGPLPNAARVRLYGVDNYTDTIPLDKAMEPTTLLAYQMNGAPLAHRHGYPLRAIVPGYFGEKHVKWITRIELAESNAKGFYETQGWGPDFIVPTRSRIDAPDHENRFSLVQLTRPIEIRGIAYGGDRGITRVEVSVDDEKNWTNAEIYYSGGKMAWSLWRINWTPAQPGKYVLVARATDGDGDVQEWEEERGWFSGVTGLHKIVVHVGA